MAIGASAIVASKYVFSQATTLPFDIPVTNEAGPAKKRTRTA